MCTLDRLDIKLFIDDMKVSRILINTLLMRQMLFDLGQDLLLSLIVYSCASDENVNLVVYSDGDEELLLGFVSLYGL
jgi:hypothetical protein